MEEPWEAQIQRARLDAKPKPKSFVEPVLQARPALSAQALQVTQADLEEPPSEQSFRQELLKALWPWNSFLSWRGDEGDEWQDDDGHAGRPRVEESV